MEATVKRALVVDDSVTMRNMIGLTFKHLGFETVQAKDGGEAFDVAEKSNFDVIVTDINMPNVDGIELIRMLRQLPNCKFTPILVITTEGGDNVKQKGREAGATGWMVKPFQPDILVSAVKKVCGL